MSEKFEVGEIALCKDMHIDRPCRDDFGMGGWVRMPFLEWQEVEIIEALSPCAACGDCECGVGHIIRGSLLPPSNLGGV